MAAPATTSAFRPPRKFSVAAGPQPYGAASSASSFNSSSIPAGSSMPSSSIVSSPATSLSGAANVSASSDGGIGSSLIVSPTGPGGAMLQSGAPTAANTIANKPAVAGSGLYQSCVILRERLWCVPGFGDRFLQETSSDDAQALNGASASATSSPNRYLASSNDPVTQLFDVFRKGAPLVELYNLLDPAKPLPTDLGDTGNSANACKKLVAKFIIALQNELGFDADEMFTVMQVYRENTNDWVKVVRVISKVIDKLEERGLLIESERPAHIEDMSKPSDDRAWIVKELIESERKYVQDLEVLQSCARALLQYNILSADRVHDLFCNVNNLVDFQRRCLINLEDNARKAPDEQRFGRAFQMLESNFDVYWPFCANYAKALEVIAEEQQNIQQLKSVPAAEGCYLDPAYELPAFLIKPVQRICKYPLLLEQLLKKSDPNGPYYDELKEGLAIVQREAAKVNEVRREQENKQLVADFESRVEDWKGHNTHLFGNLLLCDTFMVSKGETEREYLVYLFDCILLCCKEVPINQSKKQSKSNSLLKQRANSVGAAKKGKTALQLKGRIFMNNVIGSITEQTPGPYGTSYSLIVQWNCDENSVDHFSLRCKNEEQLKQWSSNLRKAAEEAAIRKAQEDERKQRQHQEMMGNPDGHFSGASSPINMAGAGAGGRRNTGPAVSMFPQTPISETGPVYPFSRADSQMGHRPSQGGRSVTDDDEGSSHSGYYPNGRATPSNLGMTRFSQPAEHRERQFSLTTEHKPRAMTENAESATLSQWRSHSPSVAPPMPRQPSNSVSATSSEHGHPSLRKASSSRQLRQNSSSQQGAAHSRPPLRQWADSSSGTQPADSIPQYDSNVPIQHPAVGRHRGESHAPPMAAGMARAYSDNGSQPMTRNRSASTSQVAVPHHHATSVPPVPRSQPGSGLGPEQLHINTNYGSRNISNGSSSGLGASAAGASAGGAKRSSNSSNSTSDSNQSGPSRPGSTAASSPLTMSAGSSTGGSLPQKTSIPAVPQRSGSQGNGVGRTSSPSTGNVVKVQVHHAGDVYMLAVLANINFASLFEKVVVKIRVCSGSKTLNEQNLKLRYIDEDGDRVALHDDDDVQMAVDHSKSTNEDIVLYVS